jgi:hypothetical protein
MHQAVVAVVVSVADPALVAVVVAVEAVKNTTILKKLCYNVFK